MRAPVHNTAKELDSRDIAARILDLWDDLQDAVDDGDIEEASSIRGELDPLELLAIDAVNYSSAWYIGTTLIRNDHFDDYAKSLAWITHRDGIFCWPFNHIDWAEAARELQANYAPVDYGGVTYWIEKT